MYTHQDELDARELDRLLAKFAKWPPQKYDDEDALKEVSYWGWHIKKQGDIILLTNAVGEVMLEGNSILNVVNRMLEKSKGRQSTPPWKEIINHADKIRNTNKG